jgi:transposase
MSRALHANYDQRFLFPPSLDEWVPAEHPARFVRDVVDTLKLDELQVKWSDPNSADGRPHYAAELLLKVWLFGWMERVRTSRQLERACFNQVPFLWLTGNRRPDHNTLWRFFKANKKAFRKIFKSLVQLAAKAGLVGWALHALDGTKLQAACSMDTADHARELTEQLKNVDAVIDAQMRAAEAEANNDVGSYAMPQQLRDAHARKALIQDALDKLTAAETEHQHVGEPEARPVKTRSHVVLGYNGQAVVDHDSDLIVAADVTTEQNDLAQLVTMTEKVVETAGRHADNTVADAGYFAGAELDKAEKRRLPVLVASPDERRNEDDGKGEFAKERFVFDAEQNEYVCPRDTRLTFSHVEKQSTKASMPYDRDVYRCHNRDCPVRDKCTQDKRGRTIRRTPYDGAAERQRARNSEPSAKIALSLRKEIVEHVFGCLKSNDGFRRFTMRGLEAARAQWALLCTAFNLRKLYAHWRSGRLVLGA